MKQEEDGDGQRERVTIAGEPFYLVGTRAPDGGIDFMATVPFENRPEKEALRQIVDKLCWKISEMTRRI